MLIPSFSLRKKVRKSNKIEEKFSQKCFFVAPRRWLRVKFPEKTGFQSSSKLHEASMSLFEYQFITVRNMFILIKCIVYDEINQYQIESPLVLSFKLETTPWTGSTQ